MPPSAEQDKFIEDFVDNLDQVGFDHSTWFLLSNKILELNNLSLFLSELKMNKEVFERHLSSPKKMQDFILVALTQDQRKRFLNGLFFKETQNQFQPVEIDSLYQEIANDFSLPLPYIDPDTKERRVYYPSIKLEVESEVGRYLDKIKLLHEWRPIDESIYCRGFFKNASVDPTGKFYSIMLNPHAMDRIFERIEKKEFPSVAKQLEVLTALKSKSPIKGLTPEEIETIRNFWLPGIEEPNQQVLDFLIKQIHVMNISKNSRRMFGDYPRKSKEAIKALDDQGETQLISDYMEYRNACLSIENKLIQKKLLTLLDHVLVIAAKESTIGLSSNQSYYPNAKRLLGRIGKELISEIAKGQNPDIHKMKSWDDLRAIKSSYSGLWGWLRNWWIGAKAQQFKVDNKDLSDVMNTLHETVSLGQKFWKISSQDGKINTEAIEIVDTARKGSGVTFGQQCQILSEDKIKKTFMVKQGKDLGETLSEELASLELKFYNDRNGISHSAAVTQLWFDTSSTNQNVKDLDNRLFVASEYYDSDHTLTASKVGGYKVRPTAARSKKLPLFRILIDLNKKCNLGLEEVIHAAARMGDFDLHSENVLLLFDLKDVSPENRLYVEELVKEFETLVTQRAEAMSSTSKLFRLAQENYVQSLADKIETIKEKGGLTFFQKIDHGNSYYNDTVVTRLDQHRTSPLRFLAGGGIALAPTNHAAEFIAAGKDDLLLTDASCGILIKNSLENQEKDITRATQHLFKELREIAKKNYSDPAKQIEAELYLLNALYKHITNGLTFDTTNSPTPVEDLQTTIQTLIVMGRKYRVEQHEKEYRERLTHKNEHELTPMQTKLKKKLEQRVEAAKPVPPSPGRP